MEINVKKFVDILLDENTRQNLVSRKTEGADLERHIQDSLMVQEWFDFTDLNIIDIGSGAGFPALILAIACPKTKFTLVESDLKKSMFLINVSKELGLDHVRVVRDRAENLGRNLQHRGFYDICTSRAVAAMNVMLEYGLPLVKMDGQVLLWKGSSHQQEISEAQRALQVLGGKLDRVYAYNLMNERDRAILAVKKVRKTPDQYPRRIGIPAKKPL